MPRCDRSEMSLGCQLSKYTWKPHGNHVRKCELCMRHSEAAQGCVVSQVICALDQWWSGGAFLLCGAGLCFLGCRGAWGWGAGRISGSGSSAHRECGCTELSRATGGESKGTDDLPCRCSRVKQLQAGEVLSCFPGVNKNLK